MSNLHRLSAALVAAAITSLGVAPPAFAGAAPAAPTPPQRVTATPPRETECATTVARLAWMAANGIPNAQCAEQRDQATPEAVASLVAKAPAGLPQWCVEHAFDGWWATRTTACSVSDWFMRVYDTGTQQLTGTMDFLVATASDLSTSASGFEHRITLRSYAQSGTAAGTGVWGMNDCEDDCLLDDDSFPTQPMTVGADVGGWATFVSLSTGPGQVGDFATSVTFLLTNPNFFTPGIFTTVTLPRGRCDNATPGASGAGCVFPDYVPAWSVDHRSLPKYTHFVRDAQQSGLARTLTRLTDTTLVVRNGDTACPGGRSDCADYPPRSTHEGAATGGGTGRTFPYCHTPGLPTGVTGPAGYAVCRVPAEENGRAAAALDAFYLANRVIEADRYRVRIS